MFTEVSDSIGGGGHSGGDTEAAPKPPYFQCWSHPMTPYFADCLCCHPKTPHCFCKMWALRSLSPKDPLFFAFSCHRKLLFVSVSSTNNHFCHFWQSFLHIPAFKALTERSKVTYYHPMPPNKPKFGFSPNDLSFFEIVFSPNAPAFGSMSLTLISIWHWSAPPWGVYEASYSLVAYIN